MNALAFAGAFVALLFAPIGDAVKAFLGLLLLFVAFAILYIKD